MHDLPIKVPLKRPIQHGDTEISELLFDEPDIAADLAFLDLLDGFGPIEEVGGQPTPTRGQAARTSMFWLSRMTGQPEEVVGRIKVSDQPAVEAAMDAVWAVIGRAQAVEAGEGGEGAEGKPKGA